MPEIHDFSNKTFLSRFKKDISQELLEFVSSPDFAKFELIIESFYISRLEDFHNETDSQSILVSQKVLNIYSNLPSTLKLMAQEIIEQRRDKFEKTE